MALEISVCTMTKVVGWEEVVAYISFHFFQLFPLDWHPELSKSKHFKGCPGHCKNFYPHSTIDKIGKTFFLKKLISQVKHYHEIKVINLSNQFLSKKVKRTSTTTFPQMLTSLFSILIYNFLILSAKTSEDANNI